MTPFHLIYDLRPSQSHSMPAASGREMVRSGFVRLGMGDEATFSDIYEMLRDTLNEPSTIIDASLRGPSSRDFLRLKAVGAPKYLRDANLKTVRCDDPMNPHLA